MFLQMSAEPKKKARLTFAQLFDYMGNKYQSLVSGEGKLENVLGLPDKGLGSTSTQQTRDAFTGGYLLPVALKFRDILQEEDALQVHLQSNQMNSLELATKLMERTLIGRAAREELRKMSGADKVAASKRRIHSRMCRSLKMYTRNVVDAAYYTDFYFYGK